MFIQNYSSPLFPLGWFYRNGKYFYITSFCCCCLCKLLKDFAEYNLGAGFTRYEQQGWWLYGTNHSQNHLLLIISIIHHHHYHIHCCSCSSFYFNQSSSHILFHRICHDMIVNKKGVHWTLKRKWVFYENGSFNRYFLQIDTI